MKHHPNQAKACTAPTASAGQAPLLGHGPAPGRAPEEAALMPQDQVSQQPSLPLPLPIVHQAMAADTNEFESKAMIF